MSVPVFPEEVTSLLERRGLRDRVYDLVLAMLLSGRVEPGVRLSIDAVARELSVSPTPVREALAHLERTGLVTREANKGYRIAPPLADHQLQALFDARLILEGGAAELAGQRGGSVVPRLEQALADQIEVAQQLNEVTGTDSADIELVSVYYSADWQFHRSLFEELDNPFLLDMSEGISTRVHRLRQVMKTGISDSKEAITEHRAIIDAFADGPTAVSAAMRMHIELVRARSRRDAGFE